MTIKAVFFDMGGTIQTFTYDRELRLKATPGLQELLTKAGIELRLTTTELYETVAEGLHRYHIWRLETLDELPTFRVWHEFIFTKQVIDLEKLKLVAEDLMFYVETHFYKREMRPEIPETLKEIKRLGLQIGLISNVISLSQVSANLKEYGIEKYFKPIVLSSEYGRRKPDPAIFYFGARLANVPTSECVYIGDRISRDVLGAKRAGFKLAIQIVHDFQHGELDEGAEPDAVIHSMTELIEILKKEIARPASSKRTATPIRALLFDAGDILYQRPNKDRRLKAFLHQLGLDGNGVSKNRMDEIQFAAYQGKLTREEYFEAILRSHGVTKSRDIQRGKIIIEEDDNDIQIFDGVADTLKSLKANGYYLGIITDTAVPVSLKLAWFEKAGFGDVWDSVISSKEMGVKKPNPQIYHAALDQLGVRPQESIFVGHMKSELDGADTLGMLTVAFNKDENATAKYYVEKFADLLNLPCIKS